MTAPKDGQQLSGWTVHIPANLNRFVNESAKQYSLSINPKQKREALRRYLEWLDIASFSEVPLKEYGMSFACVCLAKRWLVHKCLALPLAWLRVESSPALCSHHRSIKAAIVVDLFCKMVRVSHG